MRFTAYGHPNMRAAHKLTLEFTKDKDLTPKGDCIIGINADFKLAELKSLLHHIRLKMTVKLDEEEKTLSFKPNPDFCSDHEIVVRLGGFLSDRTLGTDADLAAKHFHDWLPRLKDSHQKLIVELLPE
jgi:uncharacterized protein